MNVTNEGVGRQNPSQKVKETGICSPKQNKTDKFGKTILHWTLIFLHVLKAE